MNKYKFSLAFNTFTVLKFRNFFMCFVVIDKSKYLKYLEENSLHSSH